MPYALEAIAETIKHVRENRGLSQRALAAATGMTQSQISRIEAGAVDLRLTSYIELARALDLEPMLIPRALVPAVEGLLGAAGEREEGPAYRLDDGEEDGDG